MTLTKSIATTRENKADASCFTDSDVTSTVMSAAVVKLERCFHAVYVQRMRDVPIVNKALVVRALGFRPWHDYWFGALLTPWFINLVMLPKSKSVAVPGVGHESKISLPCGEFVFLGCYEQAMGGFLSCSLLSPVTEFTGQQQAEAIVWEALQAVFTAESNASQHDIDSQEAERFQLCSDPAEMASVCAIAGEPQVAAATRHKTDVLTENKEQTREKLNRRQFFAQVTGQSAPLRNAEQGRDDPAFKGA